MGVRTQLAPGRPESIARLQWMSALNSNATTRAATDVDGKLTANGTVRNLRLILLGDAHFLDIPPATMRAAVRQWRIVPLVYSSRRNRGAVDVRSVGSSRFAARLLWGRLGAFGLPERGRLAFGFSKQFPNSRFQQLNPRLKSLEASFQTNVLFEQLLVGRLRAIVRFPCVFRRLHTFQYDQTKASGLTLAVPPCTRCPVTNYRERTFYEWLEASDQATYRNVARLSVLGIDPISCQYQYDIAHVIRGRELPSRLEALTLFFRANVESRIMAQLARREAP